MSDSITYCLDIRDRNLTLTTKYGKMVRTPCKLYFPKSEKSYWDLFARMNGVRRYKIYQYESTVEQNYDNKPIVEKVIISEELIRPSKQIKKDI